MTQSSIAAPDPNLVDVFRRVRQDSRSDPQPTDIAHTFNVEFSFDVTGLTSPVTVPTDQTIPPLATIIFPVGRLTGRLIGAELVADQIGSATVDVQSGTMLTWPISSPMYDLIPTLDATASNEIDITNWVVRTINPSDVLRASVLTVVQPMTTLTLSLIYQRLKFSLPDQQVVDTPGNTIVTVTNNPVTLQP